MLSYLYFTTTSNITAEMYDGADRANPFNLYWRLVSLHTLCPLLLAAFDAFALSALSAMAGSMTFIQFASFIVFESFFQGRHTSPIGNAHTSLTDSVEIEATRPIFGNQPMW